MSLPAGVEAMTIEECWSLLSAAAVGRLAVDNGGRPDIFPINYLVHDGSIIFRSGPGTKLAASVLMHHVAFEIDGYLPAERSAWSVVVKGRALQIERMQDVYDAQDLPLFPWVASDKPDFVKIVPDEVTGRRFHVVDDVAPDASLGWADADHPESSESDLAASPHPGDEFHPGAPVLRPD
jgi:nitroimidazol reductase NimA-like FMN-containing flavoprotein (pyridoxamine 5'-phosphate oxidase superfamily)